MKGFGHWLSETDAFAFGQRAEEPEEDSPGVVSQSIRILGSEPAGNRDSPSTGDSTRARHKPRNRVFWFILSDRSLLGRSLND
jgi:hypothetical protein